MQKMNLQKILQQNLMYLIKQANHDQEGNYAFSKINDRASKDKPNTTRWG